MQKNAWFATRWIFNVNALIYPTSWAVASLTWKIQEPLRLPLYCIEAGSGVAKVPVKGGVADLISALALVKREFKEWYSLVDSLRTSLVQSGHNLEIDMEEVGALVELAE